MIAHRLAEANKTLLVRVGSRKASIVVPDEHLTCGWLLSEVIRAFNCIDGILMLKTRYKLETLDYWLTQFERPLIPFKDKDELEVVMKRAMPIELCKEQYEYLKVIGKGGFSRVLLVRRIDSGILYAMKVIKKRFIAKQKKLIQVSTERRIMGGLKHPFIVELHWAFQNPEELCFVMDFCPGGELFFHLRNVGRFSEPQAKFYFAEVLLALEHLHSLNIVYRDLKPENILLDIDGHIRLADFGLAKDQMRRKTMSYSFCGSPEYMSPEMLDRRGHGRTIDFYSLGALLYEMLTGLPPYYSEDQAKMYDDIRFSPLPMPNFLSNGAKAMLYGLLSKNPDERLGAEYGTEEIKAHPWCSKIKWDSLYHRKVQPPYRPSLRYSNFDRQYTEMSLDEDSIGEGDIFPGFAYDRLETEQSIALMETERVSKPISFILGAEHKSTLDSDKIYEHLAPACETVRTHLSLHISTKLPRQYQITEVVTPSADSIHFVMENPNPISPSKLLKAARSNSLSLKPMSLSPSASASTISGGKFDPVKIEAKKIPPAPKKQKSMSITRAKRPKSRNC